MIQRFCVAQCPELIEQVSKHLDRCGFSGGGASFPAEIPSHMSHRAYWLHLDLERRTFRGWNSEPDARTSQPYSEGSLHELFSLRPKEYPITIDGKVIKLSAESFEALKEQLCEDC